MTAELVADDWSIINGVRLSYNRSFLAGTSSSHAVVYLPAYNSHCSSQQPDLDHPNGDCVSVNSSLGRPRARSSVGSPPPVTRVDTPVSTTVHVRYDGDCSRRPGRPVSFKRMLLLCYQVICCLRAHDRAIQAAGGACKCCRVQRAPRRRQEQS